MSSKKKKPGNRPSAGKSGNSPVSQKQKASGNTAPATTQDDSRVIPTTVKTIAGQIVEVAPKERSEDDELHEDNLEMSQLSFRQRWSVKKQRIKKEMEGMDRMRQVAYLLSYFKWHLIFIIGGILILILLIVAIKISARPAVLSAAFVNMQDEDELTEEIFNDYKNYTSPDGQKTEDLGVFKLEAGVKLDLATYELQYNNDPYDFSLTQFPVLCNTNTYDIVITDRTGLEFLSTCGMLYDPQTILTSDLISALEKYQTDSPNAEGKNRFYAYNISDTAFAKNLGISKTLYLCFPCDGDLNKTNAARFLIYIYEIGKSN